MNICIRCNAVEEITDTGCVHFYTDKQRLWMLSQKGFIYTFCLVAMTNEETTFNMSSYFHRFCFFSSTKTTINQILSVGCRHQITQGEIHFCNVVLVVSNHKIHFPGGKKMET